MSTALRLRALDAPMLVVRRSSLVLGSADASEIRIPAPAFLIEHRDGLVLFDAGLAPEAVADPSGEYGERAERLRLRFTADQRVDRQVLAAGYRLSDVTHVVLSHLHFDHAGGAHLFPSAQLVLGDGELAHARSGGDKYTRSVDVSRMAAGTVVELARTVISSATTRWSRSAPPAIPRVISACSCGRPTARMSSRGCTPRSRGTCLRDAVSGRS